MKENRTSLHWLPETADWNSRLRLESDSNCPDEWKSLVRLAKDKLDTIQTVRLDRCLNQKLKTACFDPTIIRIAVLSSSTVDHLLPSIRIAGLRRSQIVKIYSPEYGQYQREIVDRKSELYNFVPDVVLFALDAQHLVQGIYSSADVAEALKQRLEGLSRLWSIVRQSFGSIVIQHTPMPVFETVMGENEYFSPWSKAAILSQLATRLRTTAESNGVLLLSLDRHVAQDGLAAWHDPVLWHHAKQEIHPSAAPLYGDLVMRIVAAARGMSYKCLVLDLDNTLWGGVVGDDGLEGIKIGQGSALGEAFGYFQRYIKDLSQRGVILAVCSKNDEANALEIFEKHPEMVLKRNDIACFVANWNDKASNLRYIANQLNIGVDSLVFVDDNPAERAIVRLELPMVAVPELPIDPTFYSKVISDAGYFEAVQITDEDLSRTASYQNKVEREAFAETVSDLSAYLRGLEMRACWNRFTHVDQARIVQLINKTNQFNLTTQRTTFEVISQLIDNNSVLSLQIRLMDTFGDNGIVAIVIGIPENDAIRLTTWLMSCRVLGRGLEDETLNLVVLEARRLGARRLIGEYCRSAKNAMVSEHYERLGFILSHVATDKTEWILALGDWVDRTTYIKSKHAAVN